MVFTPDEEYILYITQTLVKHLHIIWIGVSALGFDFYMGPGLEYFLVPFILLSKGDPLIWGMIASFCGILTTILIYWFGKKTFNKKVGIISSLIYATSALLIYYDQQPYPTAVPLLSISMLISLHMTKHSKKWWVIFSFLYGLIFHIHLSLVLIIFVGIYWAIIHPKTWNIKTILISLFSFLIVISPLIGFDYFHKFSNITAPIRVIAAIQTSKNKTSLDSRIGNLAKSISRVFYLDIRKSNTDEILYPCNSLPQNNATKIKPFVIIAILVILIIYFSKKDIWKNEVKLLLSVYSLAFLLPFLFLSSIGSVEYYLLGFFPILILMIAYSIVSLKKPLRYFSYFLLVFFVIYNSAVLLNASGDFGLFTKRKMVNEVMSIINNSSYELVESGGPCQGTAGWGYLFSVYGKTPDKNTADMQFSWLLPIGETKKTKYKVIINESRMPINYKNYKYKFIEGGFTAYIFEN